MDGGNEIILANWPNDKHIICNINNDIPVRLPSHPYILVNRSVLCNCCIEADNHYLLESLGACNNANSKLTMYFTVNIAFVNYLDMFPNLTESLEFLLITNRTTYEQTLPITLNISRFDNRNFRFYYNKTVITPTVLDGGNEIILANWPNDKHIICNINNDIPVRLPSHPYV